MNSFNLLVFENGTFTPTQGLLVLPFNFGSLLDERLDESYVTTQRDSREHYENNTLVRIDLYQDGILSTSKYGIVANDNGYENPIGSGKYTHKLYIIEATKRLESVVCQSLTFTNALGRQYNNDVLALGSIEFFEGFGSEDYGFVTLDSLKYFSEAGSLRKYPTLQEVFDACKSAHPSKISGTLIPGTSETYTPRKESSCTYWVPSGAVKWVAETDEDLTAEIGFHAVPSSPGQSYKSTYVLLYEDDSVYEGEPYREKIKEIDVVFDFFTVEAGSFEIKFPLKRLTILDCCNRVLDLAEPLFLGETPRYAIDPAQTAWLDGILAPEFTMTQCTLREQLRIIGGYIHAEPRLVWDATKNDGTFYIHFDRYGQVTQSAQISEGTPYITKKVSQDINNYCTKIDTTASNLVNTLDFASGVIATPNIRDLTTIRTETMYVRIDESNGIVTTTFPIREIKKVTCAFFDNINETPDGGADPNFGAKLFGGELDITPYIFEKTEYDANLSSFGGGYPTSKSFALYYAIGQKNLGGLFFKPADDSFLGNLTGAQGYFQYYSIVNIISAVSGYAPSLVRDVISSNGGYPMLAFRVEYVPIYNARFSLEKQYFDSSVQNDYAKIYNQGENMIETRYYGENIRGVVARLGNVEQERTYIFKRLSQIPQIGDMVDDYAISAVSTEFSPSYIKCTVALTKDFNRISQYIGVNSTKRVYEISEREAYARNVLLKEFVVVGDEITPKGLSPLYALPMFHDVAALRSIFDPAVKFDKVSAVNACSFEKNNIGVGDRFGTVLLPVISSAFGNAMTFSWNYKDNYSAGEKTVESAQVTGDENYAIKGYWQQDVPYGNYYGRAYWYYFMLYNQNFPYDTNSDTPELNSALNLPSSALKDPRDKSCIGTIDQASYNTNNFGACLAPIRLRKDSREVLNFTYMVEFVANQPDLIIGSAMPKSCFLVSGKNNHPTGKPILVLLKRKIGKFERQLKSEDYELANVQYASVTQPFESPDYIMQIPSVFNDGQNWADYESWAIITPPKEDEELVVDEDGVTEQQGTQLGGEIIIASNNASGKRIHFTVTHKLRD